MHIPVNPNMVYEVLASVSGLPYVGNELLVPHSVPSKWLFEREITGFRRGVSEVFALRSSYATFFWQLLSKRCVQSQKSTDLGLSNI